MIGHVSLILRVKNWHEFFLNYMLDDLYGLSSELLDCYGQFGWACCLSGTI